MTRSTLVWLFLLIANGLAFAGFGFDKRRARRGEWRLSEMQLLFLALIGGTGGAYLGRWYFRHKTRKRAFSAVLHLIALAQVAFLGWAFMRPLSLALP